MTIRERMLQAQCADAMRLACTRCGKTWTRPGGMTETACPLCLSRRGVYDRSASEQVALDVTRYRLAIEEATALLRLGRHGAALTVLLRVEARGRGITTGAIIGPRADRQGIPDTSRAPQLTPAADRDDPISLVQSLALGAYRVSPKGGAHGRRRR